MERSHEWINRKSWLGNLVPWELYSAASRKSESSVCIYSLAIVCLYNRSVTGSVILFLCITQGSVLNQETFVELTCPSNIVPLHKIFYQHYAKVKFFLMLNVRLYQINTFILLLLKIQSVSQLSQRIWFWDTIITKGKE